MKLLKCLELHAKMHSYFTIFLLNVDIFTKNNSRFVISVKNCIYRYVICIFLTKNIFCMGCPPKNIFRQKYTNDISIDAVFDGDYESAIIFGKISTLKMKIVKYECILA